jgi:hypothetical protein
METRGESIMSKQSGLVSVLAVAASYLVVGTVALSLAGPARAANEEDLARPHGSFLSTSPVPADPVSAIYRVQPRVAAIYASEEDAAVPHGAFTSTMTAPENDIRLAANAAADGEIVSTDRYEVVLSSIVSHGLE